MRLLKNIENRFGVANGTLFLTACTLIIKAVGFAYKIPLYNAIGTNGAGLYQTVFALFSLLVAITATGVPSSMTKIIASGQSPTKTLKAVLKLFLPIGLIFTLFLFFGARLISSAQGNERSASLYRLISISLLFVSITACFRGYFQGLSNLNPTAISQLIEQVARAVLGVLFFLVIGGDNYKKTCYAILAVTLSELVSLVYILFAFLLHVKKSKDLINNKVGQLNGLTTEYAKKDISIKSILLVVIPLTATTLLLPLASFIDSITVINSLKSYLGERANDLYGICAGSVQAIISLPVSILHCLSVGFLPKLSRCDQGGVGGGGKGDNSGKLYAQKFLCITATLSFLASLAIIIFAPLITKILFSGLNENGLIIRLMRLSSTGVVFLSMLTASNTLLLAMGKQSFPLISMPIGIVIKTVLNLTLIKNPKINIFGLIISDVGCYFVALFLNLLYIIYCSKKQKAGTSYENNTGRTRGWQGCTIFKRAYRNKIGKQGNM